MDKKRAKAVREPVQVYLTTDERALLDALAARTGLARAEVLRRGLRSFGAEQAGGDSPLFRFLTSLPPGDEPSDVAERHDEYLAETYLDTHDA
jgi:hypothetical protein